MAPSPSIRYTEGVAKGPIEVFDFLDYRAYLRAYYAYKKEHGRSFSYRSFARRASLKSPNYLKLVMDGDRNLTPAMAHRFGVACDLQGDALRFFEHLVAFNQAKTSEDKAQRYRELSGHRTFRKAQRLEVAHAAFYTEWFIPAIRELALRDDFEADPAWIAKRMIPRITKPEAKRALKILRELELLVEDDDGRTVVADANITTDHETTWVHVGEFHRAMMKRAAESIDVVAAADRDIASLTLCVDRGQLHAIKAQLQQLRESLFALASDAKDPARVIQVNFQLFPLSSAKGDEKE